MKRLAGDLYITKDEYNFTYRTLFYRLPENEKEALLGKDGVKEVYISIGDVNISEDGVYTFQDDLDDYGRERRYYEIKSRDVEDFAEKVIGKIYRKDLRAGVNRFKGTDEAIIRLNNDYVLKISSSEYLFLDCNTLEANKMYNF